MSFARIKSLIIVILLLFNLFFLAVIVIDSYADARSERQAAANACTVLTHRGISIDPDSIKTSGAIKVMRTARDLNAEALIAGVVLGDTVISDRGAIYSYESEGRGVAEFSSGGKFEMHLSDGVVTMSGSAEKTVQKLLRSMKIEISELKSKYIQGGEMLTAVCAYKGVSIFNCTITFTFVGEELKSIDGKYVTGIETAEDGAEVSTAGTVLLGFLASVLKGDPECSAISYVEAGYQSYVAGPFGEGFIAPAWLIVTDTGRYIVDDASGEILIRQLLDD